MSSIGRGKYYASFEVSEGESKGFTNVNNSLGMLAIARKEFLRMLFDQLSRGYLATSV